ncbi:major facilitator superfamily domain-containing protein [Talaromyces proteolyticus]|uniref:Major facilitator superfamily domain-containing protein n=1 Tax=Talaromyces proteolyticus TaxID=1131652 RepID=A0AAD4KZA5_9EURO|nr:major facilitator superfamily domain-containing protein [Talaromyces proteolyticus]KAH8703777.1 major facilitator superfamily domain-containing protein [Talaromyces proteolyticus]
MTSSLDMDIHSWPPGTVLLEEQRTQDADLFLQPQPSEDPNEPLNWGSLRKHVNFGLTCLYSLLITEFLCAATPTWGPMHDELGFSWDILFDSYAIGCGFLGIGAVLLTPFALKFGRRSLYLLSIVVTFCVSIWSAKMSTVADILLINAISCLFGALSEVIIQMTVVDIFFVHQRGRMNAIFIWTVQIGASLGPLAAGYVTVSQGWRWVWWWNVVFFGICIILFAFFYEETKYIPHVLGTNNEGDAVVSQTTQRKGDTEIKCTNTTSVSCAVEDPKADYHPQPKTSIVINPNIPMRSYRQRLSLATSLPGEWKAFARHAWQPFIILVTFPGVLFVALVYGILIALQNALSTTMSSLMTEPPYNFSANQIGLMNLPLFIGVTIGSLLVGPLSDRWIVLCARRNGGIYEPESRLWLILPWIPILLAGALTFGFGIEQGLPWPVIAVGIVLCSAGVAPINIIALTYVTDSYNDIVGDALVGITFIRNAVNTGIIFALTPWFAAIGVQYVILTLALIATLILSFVMVFLKWGKRFREQTSVRYKKFSFK